MSRAVENCFFVLQHEEEVEERRFIAAQGKTKESFLAAAEPERP